MILNVADRTGIYIAFPTTDVLKSIYKPKKYKTKVNDQHTKVGIAKDCFAARRKGYVTNFDNEVQFIPVVSISISELEEAERLVLNRLCQEFQRVGRAREWFNTNDRDKIIELIEITLASSNIRHEFIS